MSRHRLPLTIFTAVIAASTGAAQIQGASATGAATARGGSPFQSFTLDFSGAGANFDTMQQEIEFSNTGGRSGGGGVASADIAAGTISISAGAVAGTNGGVYSANGVVTARYNAVYFLTSPTLPTGTPVTVDLRIEISTEEKAAHTVPVATSSSARNSGNLNIEIRTSAPSLSVYRELATTSWFSYNPTPTYTGTFGSTLLNNTGLFDFKTRDITLNGTIGERLTIEMTFGVTANVSTQFTNEQGRATLCATLGFGISPSDDVELLPMDPMIPTPPGVEVFTPGYTETFVPDDPVSDCLLDINGDGAINFFDVIAYLELYDAGDMFTDWNADTVLDLDDINQFLTSFAAGCYEFELV